MVIEIIEPNPNEIYIIRKGNNKKGLIFLIIGILFQIMVLWIYFKFLDMISPFELIGIFLVTTELIPLSSLFFIFGGGCVIISVREIGWNDIWIIQNQSKQNSPGIHHHIKIFILIRKEFIPINQIQTLRIHTIPLDKLKYFNKYRLEIDILDQFESSTKSIVIYSDDRSSAKATINHLARRIQKLLNLSKGIEKTEAPMTKRELTNI